MRDLGPVVRDNEAEGEIKRLERRLSVMQERAETAEGSERHLAAMLKDAVNERAALRAVLVPSDENATWLQNLLLEQAGVLVAKQRAGELLRALCERGGIKP